MSRVFIWGLILSGLTALNSEGLGLSALAPQSSQLDRVEFEVLIPFRKKVFEISDKGEGALLDFAKINENSRKLHKTYAVLAAGEVVEPGDSFELTHTDGYSAVVDGENLPLIGVSDETFIAPSYERLQARVIHHTEQAGDSQQAQLVLLVVFPSESDIYRAKNALLKLAIAQGNAEQIERLESYDQYGVASGFLVLSDASTDSHRMHRVQGSVLGSKFQLRSSPVESRMAQAFDPLLDAILDKRFQRSDDESIRSQYVSSANAVSDLSVEFAASREKAGREELQLGNSSDSSQFNVEIFDSEAVDVSGPIKNAELLKWSNAENVETDRQQFVALALSPKFTEGQSTALAAVTMHLDPEVPANDHACSDTIAMGALHGNQVGEFAAEFSYIYSQGSSDADWTIRFARFGYDEAAEANAHNSKLAVWSFKPDQRKSFEVQSVYSGVKIFLNSSSEFSSIPIRW